MRDIEEENKELAIAILLICTGLGFIFPIAAKWILFGITVVTVWAWGKGY